MACVASLVLWLPTPSGSSSQRLTVAGLLVFVPLADQALVVAARLSGGRGIMTAATDHTSHRLRARGWSARPISGAMAGTQVAASLAAIAGSAARGAVAIGVLTAVTLLVGLSLLALTLRLPPRAEGST